MHGQRIYDQRLPQGIYTLVRTLTFLGRVRVDGFEQVENVFLQGGVIVVSNHPSLVEPFCLTPVISRFRFRGDRSNPYTLVDTKGFGSWYQRLENGLRLLPVDRSRTRAISRDVYQRIVTILDNRGILIYYPEGGRTCKGSDFVYRDARYIRVCTSDFLVSLEKNLTSSPMVVPVWVDQRVSERPESLWCGFWKLFRRPLRITFGTPVPLAALTTGEKQERDERLAQLLLTIVP